MFWSAWSIIWGGLKSLGGPNDPETNGSVERILDACEEVLAKSITPPLILFPLVVGVMRTRKKVYDEFVLNRLEGLRNLGLTDAKSLYNDLKTWWWTERSASEPNDLSRFVF